MWYMKDCILYAPKKQYWNIPLDERRNNGGIKMRHGTRMPTKPAMRPRLNPAAWILCKLRVDKSIHKP